MLCHGWAFGLRLRTVRATLAEGLTQEVYGMSGIGQLFQKIQLPCLRHSEP